ncbi:MAG: sensor histidine kinase, partial [Hasllibacter sp.]
FIETLRGPARDDPGARERFLALMAREAGRMDRLIADLLALSRVEGASRERPAGRIPLAPAIRRVRETMLGRAGEAGVAIALDLPQGDGPEVRADADQIEQVLANLVENALKYGAREGGTVRIALSGPAPDAPLRGPAVRIEVSDDGPGVDPSHLPRLTERFYRADDHRARGEGRGGTGLGLSIVKHIVQRHRGRMSLAGGLGQGLRVRIHLPAD